MEIELKFTIPDEAMYQRLLDCRELAGFRIEPGATVTDRDEYVDTADRRLIAAGYACRLRHENGTVLVTLKSFGGTSGAVHRRDEREVHLTVPSLAPADWPDGPARWLAMDLAAGAPLQPLLELSQTRARRDMFAGDRLVAEMTVDLVEPAPGNIQSLPAQPEDEGTAGQGPVGAAPAARYFELEVELKGQGHEGDLEPLERELKENWGLVPQDLSKFERALAVLSITGAARIERLAPHERDSLQRLASERSRPLARRAAIVLAWSAGQSTRDIASHIGVSMGRARYWIRSFRARRMEIFDRTRFGRQRAQAIRADDGDGTGSATGDTFPQSENAAAEPVEAQVLAGEAAPAQGGDTSVPAEVVSPAEEQAPPEEAAPAPAIPRPLSAEDPMSEAGRSIMYIHYQKMCDNEAGTREGEDSEALHDMRVATRRMRAAYDLFVPYYDEKVVKPFRKGLRNTGHALGDVRDLDVLLEKAEKYQEKQASARARNITPMLDAWRERRDSARDEMLDYLDSKAYRQFKKEFESFLTTPGAGSLPMPDGAPVPYQVRHVVPRLLLGRYQDVRAYESVLATAPLATYHQLRIACKKLRYAMEFFKDVLGEPTSKLIKQVTAAQDLLGDLHDSVVAEELAAAFLSDQIQRRPNEPSPVDLSGVTDYLAAQWAAQHDLLAKFPELWGELGGYDFRRGLSLAIAAL